MDTETVSVRIRKETYSRVVALAEAEFRPIVGMMELLLRDSIDARQASLGGTPVASQGAPTNPVSA